MLKARLADRVPARSIHVALILTGGIAILALAGLGVRSLVRPPATPASPSAGATPPVATATPTLSAESARLSPEAPASGQVAPGSQRVLLPLVVHVGPDSTSTPAPSAVDESSQPRPTPTLSPADFDAARERLQAEGKALAYVKIGLHAGPGGNARGLGEYLAALASVGVPAVIKSVDNYGVCAQALRESPDNVAVFRMSGGDLELPGYDLPAETAAEEHWRRVLDALPPEFDQRTWLEVMNEPDKTRADWLGRFAYRIGELALTDGYRFAAFGWSSGEPEPGDWQTPGMLAFLTLASQYPDQIAVAVHEYSFTVDDIANGYPDLVGRFQTLFRVCDERGIARPTVLVTEWGWEAQLVPPVDQAMDDIAWASELYAAYPEVRGVALWYLGGGYGGIADRAQKLILPLRYHAWSEYYAVDPDHNPVDRDRFRPQ